MPSHFRIFKEPPLSDASKIAFHFFYHHSHRNKKRLITSIHGIPFYQSTGTHSHQPETWFPFLGIRKRDQWLIKPQKEAKHLPRLVKTYIKEHDIKSNITIMRLGNIKSMCISASLGGGFWDTPKGIPMKQFLQDFYSKDFLDEGTVTRFKVSIPQECESIAKPRDVNERLEILCNGFKYDPEQRRIPRPS